MERHPRKAGSGLSPQLPSLWLVGCRESGGEDGGWMERGSVTARAPPLTETEAGTLLTRDFFFRGASLLEGFASKDRGTSDMFSSPGATRP